jgi:hypothetical protein
MKSRILFTLSLLLLFGAGTLKADAVPPMLLFTLTGPVDASFELPRDPYIAPGNADPGFGFLVMPVDLTIDGVASNDILAFYGTAGGGGFAAFDSDWDPDFSLYGAPLYKRGEWDPKFDRSNDPISLTDENGNVYTLTMTKVKTPEPSSLMLLGLGLLPLGLLAKRWF